MTRLVLIAATVAACANDGGAAPAKDTTKPVAKDRNTDMDPIRVEWQLARDDAKHQLTVTYKVTNTGKDAVVLLDRLVAPSSKGLEPAFDRAVVQSIDADTVAFVRGYVAPTHPIGGVYPPGARALEPGKSLDDKIVVPLPIAGWHNFATAPQLQGRPKQAVLQIGYLVGHDKWGEVPLTDGSKLRVPNPPYVAAQKLAKSDPKPLP